MAIDLDTTRFFMPVNSVVDSKIDIKNADDNVVPFTYTDWLDRSNLSTSKTREDYSQQYNAYLRKWREVFDDANRSQKQHVIQKYKTALKNIAVNFTTDEQKRFLSTLDYKNPRHVESAIALFAQKLKEISVYYATERQNTKQQRTDAGNTGTTEQFERFVKNVVPRLARQREIVTGDLRNDKLVVDSDDSRVVVKVVELYDIGESNPKTGAIEYDANLYLDYEQAVRQLLVECTPILNLTADGSVSLTASNVSIDDQSVSLLDYSNFEDYIKDESGLNIKNIQEYIPKLLGSDIMYLSAGETYQLIEATHPWRNMFNRYLPAINNTKETVYRTKAQIGDLYIPSNLGIMTFFSHNPVLTVTDADYTGKLPDPSKFGPSPYTGSNDIPISLQGDVTWLKADVSNDKLAGDIVVPKHTPKFYAYRSDEETKNYARYGVSRWQDPTGFFDGDGNRNWANPDVFPPRAHNIYDIDSRQETLMVNDKTATEWSTDIHGNEYVTIKQIKSTRAPLEFGFGEGEDDAEPEVRCITIDGGDTLEKQLEWFEAGDEPYNIYDGGRHPGIDPKIEQAPRLLPFPDLRVNKKYRNEDGTFREALEPTNAFYYGPNADGSQMLLQSITYKGFTPTPFYDYQAYCGLFTDEACGVTDPSALDCNVFDGYAFGTYSDGVSSSGDDNLYMSLDRGIVDLLAGENVAVDGKTATVTRDHDMPARYTESYDNTTTISASAYVTMVVYDHQPSDAVKSSFNSTSVPLVGSGDPVGTVSMQSVSAGRGNEITITGDGVRKLDQLVSIYNSNNTVKIDTESVVGGDLYIKEDVEMKLTGSKDIIVTSDCELTLYDTALDHVKFIADVSSADDQITRNSSTQYTFGVLGVNDPEKMTQVLTNVINTANSNGDLQIMASRYMVDGYIDGLRLMQKSPGPGGNTPLMGSMLTGSQRFLRTIDIIETVEYTRDQFGYLTGPINKTTFSAAASGDSFVNGSSTNITTTQHIELLAETPGPTGNNIVVTGDGVTQLWYLAEQWNEQNSTNRVKVIRGAEEVIQQNKTLQLTGGHQTQSFNFRAGSIQEAYTNYVNRGFDYYDYDIGFSRHGQPQDVEIVRGPVVDAADFLTGVCAEEDAEFEYETDRTIALYDDLLPVAETQYAEYTAQDAGVEELTLYEQNMSAIGDTIFRSYNSGKIEYLSETVDRLIAGFSLFEGSDFDQFREEFTQGKVRSSQVFVDVLYVETESFVFVMKLNFNTQTTEFDASTAPVVILRSFDEKHPDLGLTIQPYYNSKQHTLMVGFIRSFEQDNNVYASPRLFNINLNTMHFYQLFPNNDYPESAADYILTDQLEGYTYRSVDRPILSYNDTIDMYTMTFSCVLEKITHDENNVVTSHMITHGVCISDFEFRAYNLRLTDVYMHHTNPVKKFERPTPAWVPRTYEKTIRLWPDDELIPVDDHTSYAFSLSSMESTALSSYEFDLEIDTKTIPTSSGAGYRVNRMLFDPGDGSDIEVVDRVIASGLEALDFDVSELPDQSDLYDPRRLGFKHKYRFSDFTSSVTTATVTAVFSNFKNIVYNINIETAPFTIESGFEDVKLLDSRVYMTDDSKCKQLLLLETQNPRYVSQVVLDRDKYTNANVMGYVNGERYAGPWHAMSNGVLMTGAEHTPGSQVISLTRDESLNATTAVVNEIPTLFNNTDPTYTGVINNAGY